MIPADYFHMAQARESGGNPNAQNPRSSAQGLYQFIDSTWNDLMTSRPDLGLTPDGRNDPQQQQRAMQAFTEKNAGILSQAGIPVDNNSLYAAHRFGAGGAQKMYGADPMTPMNQVFDAKVMNANPDLQNKNVGGILSPQNQTQLPQGAQPTAGVPHPAMAQQTQPPQEEKIGYDWARGLGGAGAALASISSPSQGAALASLIPAPTKAGTWSSHYDPATGSIIKTNNKTGEVRVSKNAASIQKVDPTILKSLSEDWGSKYGNLHATAEKADYFKNAIEDGRLDLSFFAQWLKNPAANIAGSNQEQVKLMNEFNAFRTQMANDSLRLNNGVQTEGDAIRAKEEFASGTAGYNGQAVASQLGNFVTKAGKVMNSGAKAQLDSYSAQYNNPDAFKPYYDKLETQSKFYRDYDERQSARQQRQAPQAPAGGGYKVLKVH